MRYLLLLALLIVFGGGRAASDQDRGCAIDPNGCPAQTLGDEAGFIDPNG